ncbi:unnamed protein product, partial [Mesorhabditis belari]|uniref:Coronin n=1 Tax=Mesorhabditis belari TaxID=2138241 RepID=A0AAF3FEJ6_9BILA
MPSKQTPTSPKATSKFRHIFGQTFSKQESYDWGTARCHTLAVNPRFVTASLDGPSAGCILVSRIQDCGKFSQTIRLSEHKSTVLDLKWNPFNDNILASASADNTVKIWHIKNDGSGHVVRTLAANTRRVEQIEWHPTVDDVLLIMGADSKIILWDAAGDKLIFEIDDYLASCVAFSPNASLFAATAKNKHRVTIFDSRTGNAMKSTSLPHEGNASLKVLFSSQTRILTFGTTKANRRQFAIFSLSSFNSPLCVVDIDGSSGLLMPVFDNDLNILFVTGKGDTVIRFYELLDQPPWSIYLNETCQHLPHTAIAHVPKRALNFSICEIFRFYRLHPEFSSVIPLSVIAPKRSECAFHSDLFPQSKAPTPALSLAEWRAGLDLPPVLIQLRVGMPVTTSKPVHLKGRGELITADVNNDRKFRFLSLVTKPDYRTVPEREDCDDIMKLEEVKNKLANSQANSFSSNERCSEEEFDVTTASQLSLDSKARSTSEIENQKESFSKENNPPNSSLKRLLLGSNPSIASAPAEIEKNEGNLMDDDPATEPIVSPSYRERGQSAPLAQLEDATSPEDPHFTREKALLQREFSSPAMPFSETEIFAELGSQMDKEMLEEAARERSEETTIDKEATPKAQEINEAGKKKNEEEKEKEKIHLQPSSHLHVSASARELRSTSPRDFRQATSPCRSETGTLSRPGTISPRLPQTVLPRPAQGYETPKWAQKPGKQPKFAHRCVDLDATLDDADNGNSSTSSFQQLSSSVEGGGTNLFESSLVMLEKSLRKSDARNSQLERLVQLQQQDIESLRFEIEWKDERIAYLQAELMRLEAQLPVEATTELEAVTPD